MKKAAIIVTTLLLGITQADYSIKYPLEQSNGGSLPNDSISFTTGSGTGNNNPNDNSSEECSYRPYDADNGITYGNQNIRLWRTYFNKNTNVISQLDAYFDTYSRGESGYFPDGEIYEENGYSYYPNKSELHDTYEDSVTIGYTYTICRKKL